MRPSLSAFPDLSLRQKGLVVVSIPVVALLIAVGALALAQERELQAAAAVTHTFEVRQDLQAALTLLVDAETATRGYLLTRRLAWLEPYRQSRERLPLVLSRLEILMRNNPLQLGRLRRLQEMAGRRLESLAALQRQAGAGRPTLDAELEKSKSRMDELRHAMAEMQDEERALLEGRQQEAARARRRMNAVTAAALVIGLLGGAWAIWLFGRHIARRIDRLRLMALRLARRQPLPLLTPARDEVGQLSAALVETDRLLTEREAELHETETFLQHLIETSPTVVFQQDPRNMQVTYVSPNVERLLGYSVAEILAAPNFWTEHIHPDEREQIMVEDQRAFRDRAAHWEAQYRFLHKDGTYRWLHSFVHIEYDASGAPANFLGHRLDITPRKLAEAAVLEREAHLDAANKELEAFSYSVSHDLRAPLRSIDGFSQALLEDCAGSLDTTGRQYLDRVRAATQRMGLLIDDLLNLSRVSRSPLRREPVDLSQLASVIAQELRQSQPDRAVELVIAPGLSDEADPGLLRIVLENLLDNAWKFTARHARARIEFGREGDAYFVRDDGAGFDPDYAGKLFGAFQRLHHDRDFAGTGIGLATVQRIIHRHGGELWAQGQVEQGATFYFTLPPAVPNP